MPDETQTPPDVPTPPMDSINLPQGEPVSPTPSEPAPASELAPGEPTPAPEPDTPTPPSPEATDGQSTPSASGGHPFSIPTPIGRKADQSVGSEEGRVRGDIAKARAAMQDRKRKKLDKIMAKLAEKNKVTNDEVEKLLRVSDATATRYLEALKKENKIKQTGKTGAAVFYEKI